MKYPDVLNNYKILNETEHNLPYEKIVERFTNGSDGISATISEKIVFSNPYMLLTDSKGNKYYSIRIHYFDALDNMSVDVNGLDVELYWNIGEQEFKFDSIKELLPCCLLYHEIKLVIKLNKLPEPEPKPEVTFNYRCYIFSQELRDMLKEQRVEVGLGVYTNGLYGWVGDLLNK